MDDGFNMLLIGLNISTTAFISSELISHMFSTVASSKEQGFTKFLIFPISCIVTVFPDPVYISLYFFNVSQSFLSLLATPLQLAPKNPAWKWRYYYHLRSLRSLSAASSRLHFTNPVLTHHFETVLATEKVFSVEGACKGGDHSLQRVLLFGSLVFLKYIFFKLWKMNLQTSSTMTFTDPHYCFLSSTSLLVHEQFTALSSSSLSAEASSTNTSLPYQAAETAHLKLLSSLSFMNTTIFV